MSLEKEKIVKELIRVINQSHWDLKWVPVICAATVATFRLAMYFRTRSADKCLPETCVICYTFSREVILMPCRHTQVCKTCSKELERCPVCRNPISSKISLATLYAK